MESLCTPQGHLFERKKWLTPWHRTDPVGKGHLFLNILGTMETGVSSEIVFASSKLCSVMSDS